MSLVYDFPQKIADKVYSFPQSLANKVYGSVGVGSSQYDNLRALSDSLSPNYYIQPTQSQGAAGPGMVGLVLGLIFVMILLVIKD